MIIKYLHFCILLQQQTSLYRCHGIYRNVKWAGLHITDNSILHGCAKRVPAMSHRQRLFALAVYLFVVHHTSSNLNPLLFCVLCRKKKKKRSTTGFLINTQTHLDNFCMTHKIFYFLFFINKKSTLLPSEK